MADTDLTIERQDLFSANQIIQLVPLIGEEAYRELLAANPFVERLYPNFSAGERRGFVLPLGATMSRMKRLCETLLGTPSVLIEALSRTAYSWHLGLQTKSWRTPNEVRLSSDCLKLHSRSHRSAILRRFNLLCDEALKDARLPDDVMPATALPARQAVNS